MRAVTPEFAALQGTSKTVGALVDVEDAAGNVLRSFTSVISGTVTQDRLAAVRSRCDLSAYIPFSLVPGTLITEESGKYGSTELTFGDAAGTYGQVDAAEKSVILTPFGNRVRIKRGVLLPTGWEWVSLGVFRMQRVGIEHTPRGVIATIAGSDASREISRNRWSEPFVIPAGTNYATAIQNLIANRYPSAAFAFTTTTYTTPHLVYGLDAENDPWRDATDMAEAAGLELFVNGDGVFVLQAPPDPNSSAAVIDLTGAVILGSSRVIDDEQIRNRVVATGETVDGQPLRAVAEDNNPASLTYVGGPFGVRTAFFPSPLLTSAGMVANAAQTMLEKLIGFDEDLSLRIPANPALEAGDVVTVKAARSKLAGAWIVDAVTVPLGASGEMNVTLHRRRSTL